MLSGIVEGTGVTYLGILSGHYSRAVPCVDIFNGHFNDHVFKQHNTGLKNVFAVSD
jgi:hypothetical protein